MRGLERVGGRVVWSYGSEGLHEMRVMRGWKGEGCLVVLVRGITRDEGLEGEGGGGLSVMRGWEGEGCLVAWFKGIT